MWGGFGQPVPAQVVLQLSPSNPPPQQAFIYFFKAAGYSSLWRKGGSGQTYYRKCNQIWQVMALVIGVGGGGLFSDSTQ